MHTIAIVLSWSRAPISVLFNCSVYKRFRVNLASIRHGAVYQIYLSPAIYGKSGLPIHA